MGKPHSAGPEIETSAIPVPDDETEAGPILEAEPIATGVEPELVDELADPDAAEAALDLALDDEADLGGPDLLVADLAGEDDDLDAGSDFPAAPPRPRPDRPVPAAAPLEAGRTTGLAHSNALSAYMAQLRHHAPITREEEHALAVRWVEDGDVEAAKALVVSNLRLVVKIAMEYRRAWTNTLDLVQEGNVGLMEAVQRFDPYQGVKLSSYAVYWIRAYILKYILDNMRSVRLGTTRASRKLFFRLNKEKRELERLGYEAEPRLLAERLDVTEEDVTDMEARLSRPDVSFDAPLRADEADGATFGDRMASPGISSEASVGASELRAVFQQKIEAFAETLDERDLQILRERILAEEPPTLPERGERFAVTRERVRQLEAKLVKRLRRYMEENLVDFEYYGPGAG
ncbi:MAG: RNA polymerase factor sigma-32 [Myxococcota bacterium]